MKNIRLRAACLCCAAAAALAAGNVIPVSIPEMTTAFAAEEAVSAHAVSFTNTSVQAGSPIKAVLNGITASEILDVYDLALMKRLLLQA